MDGYEDTRRKFLKKLGLTFGVTMVASSSFSAVVLDQKEDFPLINAEQQQFMHRYEKWMDEFIQVIRVQRVDPENMDNNKKLVELSATAKAWQPKLTEYMKDENFARHYMVATGRMTNEIR